VVAVTQFASKDHILCYARVTFDFRRTTDDISIELRECLMFLVQLIPGAISEMLASVTDTGCLTLADRYGLMAAVLDESLEDEYKLSINRLLRSVLKGRVKIVNELSAIW
jgi:phage gp36-like protein